MGNNIFLILIIMSFAMSSCYRSSEERRMRNIIEFKDAVPVVEDSIRAMEALLEKLPDAEIKNYWIDNGYLSLNSNKIGELESLKHKTKIDTIVALNSFSKEEIHKLISLSTYLRENFIVAAYSHPVTNRFLFDYKGKDSDGYNESRKIITVNSKSDTLNNNFTSTLQILDRKGGLVLVAPNDAIISK